MKAWLKWGLIFAVASLIVIGLFGLLRLVGVDFRSYNEFAVVFLVMGPGILASLFLPYLKDCSLAGFMGNPVPSSCTNWVLTIILIILVNTIIYFIIGALIGFIISKIGWKRGK